MSSLAMAVLSGLALQGGMTCLVVLGSLVGPAPAPPLSEPLRLRLTWENDLFAGEDGHYTNGAEVRVSGPLDPDRLPLLLSGGLRRWDVAFGQQIYTPADTSTPTPDATDRPYAGLLYLRFGITRRDPAEHVRARLELTVGVVGPASAAEVAQRLSHRLSGSELAEGWGGQLRTEPAVGLRYAVSPRVARGEVAALDADLSADAELAVGSLTTHVGVGATLRLGLHVPEEYLVARAAPWRCYVTASVQLRAVGYDLLLDGNLLHPDGPSVRKQVLVAEVSLGLTVAVADGLTFSYRHTYRSPQFAGQRQGDQFGSLALTLSW